MGQLVVIGLVVAILLAVGLGIACFLDILGGGVCLSLGLLMGGLIS